MQQVAAGNGLTVSALLTLLSCLQKASTINPIRFNQLLIEVYRLWGGNCAVCIS